jgi:hypothetical protein
MRKYLLILCILLPLSGLADDRLDSLREVADDVRLGLNIATNATCAPDSVVFDIVRDAYLVAGTDILGRLIIDTVVSAVSGENIAIDSNIVFVDIVRWINKDSSTSLVYTPIKEWRDLSVLTGRSGWTAHPKYFDWRPGYIVLYQTPIAIDTFIVYGYGKISDIMTDSTFVSDFPVSYRMAPLFKARALLGAMIGHPRYETWEKFYMNEVAKINLAIRGRKSGE